MRHRHSGRHFGLTSPHRKAMYRNMATSLLQHGRIQTTDQRAKELRKVVERLITLSKRVPPSEIEKASPEDATRLRARRVHAVRLVRRWVKDRDVLQRLFSEYSERYQDRQGGYTRITKISHRHGDNAQMSLIELVEEPCTPRAAKKAAADVAQDVVAAEVADARSAEPAADGGGDMAAWEGSEAADEAAETPEKA